MHRGASHVTAVLTRNPDLAGVFGANTFSGSGAAQGVKNAGKEGVGSSISPLRSFPTRRAITP